MGVTRVDLLRHGEPLGGRRYRGQTDDPLSEKGWRQMWDAVGDCRAWDAVAASPLQRCAAFAEALGAQLGLAAEYDARWKEIGFGAWEGHTPQELEAAEPGVLLRFRADPIACAPTGAEPLPEFCNRVCAAWADLLCRHAGGHVLLVAHAGVIRAILAQVLGLPLHHMYRLQIASAGISRVQVETTRAGEALPALLFLNGKI